MLALLPGTSPRALYRLGKYTLLSFVYNSQVDLNYTVDTILNPFFFTTYSLTASVGPYLVAVVSVLLSSVIGICYIIGIEWYLRHELYKTLAVAFVIGHYIQLGVWCHLYRGVMTDPGHPTVSDPTNTDVCKRCLFPKPARTHHCSVCRQCVLRMDHHCPWLNNCVGLHTHRHFYLFSFFTLVGCIFITVFGVPVLFDFFYTVKDDHYFTSVPHTYLGQWVASKTYDRLVFYMLFMVAGGGICLLVLFGWHTSLILANETSIERKQNQFERSKRSKLNVKYNNPFDRGLLKNVKEVLLYDNQDDSLWWILSPYHIDTECYVVRVVRNYFKKKNLKIV